MVRKIVPWVLMSLLAGTAGCDSGPTGSQITAEDVSVLRAALHERCAVGQSLSPVADLPHDLYRDDGFAHVQFGLDLESRRAGEARWPQGWLCHAVKVVEKTPHAGNLAEASLPAYSPDGQRAVVFLSAQCGLLCGQTWYVELRKVEGAWRVSGSALGSSS